MTARDIIGELKNVPPKKYSFRGQTDIKDKNLTYFPFEDVHGVSWRISVTT